MARLVKFLTGLAVGLGLVPGAFADVCGSQNYDPNVYVCYDGRFLCPIINGEGLAYCNGACYSRFMYQCINSGTVLAQLPQLAPGTRFALSAWNPRLPVHGQPISACGLHWWIGGPTCSYCPVAQVGSACPPGTATAMVFPGGMNTEVPGGQQYYLDAYWNVGYTQAHSAAIPPGSTVGGLVAYSGGGFVNLNGPGTGWVACPPTAAGGGGDNSGRWNLVSANATTLRNLGGCTGVNLAVQPVADQASAWQYT